MRLSANGGASLYFSGAKALYFHLTPFAIISAVFNTSARQKSLGANVNTGRQQEVDMARVLAIVTMVFIHVFEIIEPHLEFEEWFHCVIEFIGGPLSGPVFMTAMGIGMAYSNRQEAPLFARRGVFPIAQGYWLNLLRDP